MNKWFVVVALVMLALGGAAQPNVSQLSSQDQAQLKAIQEKVHPSTEVFNRICNLFLSTQEKQNAISERMDELANESSSAALEELNKLSAEKKALKEDRDLSIELELTPEQREIYTTQIKIAKPQVLHFGQTHDRMNCPVCVPKP